MRNQKNELLSAFNKAEVVPLAIALIQRGYVLYATEGTAKYLRQKHGLAVTNIATLIGKPLLKHRVVTLSRRLHARLRSTPEDLPALNSPELSGMPHIDLVYVELTPLTYREDMTASEKRRAWLSVDVGGRALLSSAANGERIVICSPFTLRLVMKRLPKKTENESHFKIWLAIEAEDEVAQYSRKVANFYRRFADE